MWERRSFLWASIVGGAGVLATGARAQRRGSRVVRPEWSERGAPEGREMRDPTAPTEEERMHAPVVRVPPHVEPGRAFDIAIQIGMSMHPMTDDHHIGWIDCFIGDTRAWVIDLSPAVPFPVVRVPMRLTPALGITVRAWCNRHGVWRTHLTT